METGNGRNIIPVTITGPYLPLYLSDGWGWLVPELKDAGALVYWWFSFCV